MAKYYVTIHETYSNTFEVEAISSSDEGWEL